MTDHKQGIVVQAMRFKDRASSRSWTPPKAELKSAQLTSHAQAGREPSGRRNQWPASNRHRAPNPHPIQITPVCQETGGGLF